MNKELLYLLSIFKTISNYDTLDTDYYNSGMIEYGLVPKVNDCLLKIYFWMFELLNQGLSLEEINKKIDELDIDEFKKLNVEEQSFVKNDVKNILALRKKNIEKESE